MEPWGATLFGDPCPECGFDWSISPEVAVAEVARLPARLTETCADSLGTERRSSGGWTVTEYVSHVGDNLRQWAERVQGARLVGAVDVSGYDPDALATARSSAALPVEAAVWSTAHSVRMWVDVMSGALDEGVELNHATRGSQRAEDVARNNCHDALHHLWDIGQILREGGTPPK